MESLRAWNGLTLAGIIAYNLSKADWSWGASAIDSDGRTIWIPDTRRGDGQRFVVHADES